MAKIEKKQVIVNEIKEKLDKATSVVLVDALGLTVEQDTALRKALREAQVDYKVYKNTLINFAVADTQFESLKSHLEGPTTLAVTYGDPTAAASIIKKFAKTANTKEKTVLSFKAGYVDGVEYDADGLKTIADIPSREVLLSKLLGSLQSPMATFARVIKAIADKDAAPAEAEA